MQSAGFELRSPWLARWALCGAVALAAVGVWVTFSPARSGFADRPASERPNDVALYNAEIRRLRAGESYYDVAASELRPRGYPTASVFNWRTPLPMWLIARLPESTGKVLLGALAVLLVGCGARLLAGEGGLGQGACGGVLLFGAVMPVFLADLYVMPELWGGVLLGLSVCAYGQGRWGWGVAAGAAALFCRELAGPYCLASGVWAVYQRRWKEAAAWAACLMAYALFYALHLKAVHAHLRPGDAAHQLGWLRLGGLPFVISLAQLNAYLLVAPQWWSALYLALSLLGLAACTSSLGRRAAAAVCLHVVMFAVVGQPFNQYWGALLAPLLSLGAARCPWVAKELWMAALPKDHGGAVATFR